MRTFFDQELDTIATYWQVLRRDGVALGFTSHDVDIAFEGMVHRAAPGMVPTAIRLTSDLSEESAGVEGALSHASIREEELAVGLFDAAAIRIGAVDWETSEYQELYSGVIRRTEDNGRSFSAELQSLKASLEMDLVPRTSPTCRAQFCGPGCNLSAQRFTARRPLDSIDFNNNRVRFAGVAIADFIDGLVRFLDGPQTGIRFGIVSALDGWLTLDRPLAEGLSEGTIAELREGCDHTVMTCGQRFGNAVNFRGEPFLPGNDLLARYGQG